MKIQRSTLILTLVALGLASGIYLQQRLTAPDVAGEVRSEGAEPLFDFDEADVVKFTINRPDLSLSLERRSLEVTGDAVADLAAATVAQSQPDWSITVPEQTPASDGAVAFLLSLLATGDRRDGFEVLNDGQSEGETQQRLAEFGLDQPMAQVDLTLADGTSRQLILGNSNFDDSGIYAVQDVEASDEAFEVFLVNSSLEPAVLRPLEEWRYTAELPDENIAEEDEAQAEEAAEELGDDSGIEAEPGSQLDNGPVIELDNPPVTEP